MALRVISLVLVNRLASCMEPERTSASCLLQLDPKLQTTPQKAVGVREDTSSDVASAGQAAPAAVSAHDNRQSESGSVHDLPRNATLVDLTAANREAAVAAVSKPNGPALMNMTKMNQDALEKDSRHINGKTVAADWHQEYPLEEGHGVEPEVKAYAGRGALPSVAALAAAGLAAVCAWRL
mmetsp:Transcript_17427/g.32885  ORF Transcript_17427/g.32885 Transcript_17427/m.32885 type:complete len:181 (-) Transcript_17427:79-621(-)